MITTDELRILCESRYGKNWQTGLAQDIADLTHEPVKSILVAVHRWAKGTQKPTAAAEAAIRLLTK